MQPDTVRLVVGSYEISELERLELTRNLYDPSGAFSLVLGRQGPAVEDAPCAIFINGRVAMTGIIETVEEYADDSSHAFNVSGRSLYSEAEENCITDWTSPPRTLAAAAKKYLAPLSLLGSRTWEIEGMDPSREHAQLEVGDTVAKILNEYAQNRGLIVWCKPDGNLVFGKAHGKGEPAFRLDSSNIKSRRRAVTSKGVHSEIWVVSDSQESGHQVHKATNTSVKRRKVLAAAYNGTDSAGLSKQALEYRRQEKIQSFQTEFQVAGLSQNGKVWTENELVQVEDDITGIRGTYLIVRVVYHFGKTGSTSSVVVAPILAEDVFKAYRKGKKKDDQW